ncbi:hypothetical protein F2P81_017046 [Scophthalmus maximus]|uniref:Uncharacterized protein n=1 Tax=Scophthalmus maximus TaxID=52904 RepID=A0A6A4SCX6_SCOMX|nr:hypothetical protein F2P81_017046 [Scophthalmus maximus]
MPFCEKKLSVKLFNPNLTVDAALLIANTFIINAVSVNDLIGVSRSGNATGVRVKTNNNNNNNNTCRLAASLSPASPNLSLLWYWLAGAAVLVLAGSSSGLTIQRTTVMAVLLIDFRIKGGPFVEYGAFSDEFSALFIVFTRASTRLITAVSLTAAQRPRKANG